jgi:hypothetical protein
MKKKKKASNSSLDTTTTTTAIKINMLFNVTYHVPGIATSISNACTNHGSERLDNLLITK